MRTIKRVDVAYVLLFDETLEKVLMVRNKGDNSSYITLPGGAVEEGETLEEAAIREVKEETGVDVKIDGLFSISEAFFEEKGHHAVFFTFIGKIVGGEIEILFPNEIEEVIWREAEEAENYIHIPNELKGLVREKNSVPYIDRGSIVNEKK